MSRQQQNPLRPLLEEERQRRTRLSRGQAIAASSVARAKALLAVADGDSYTEAARAVGRRSGDAVASLVARFNTEGVAAVVPRPGGGHQPDYSPELDFGHFRQGKRADPARPPNPPGEMRGVQVDPVSA